MRQQILSAVGIASPLLVGDFGGIVAQLSLEALDNILPASNVSSLYVESLNESLSDNPLAGSLSKSSIEDLLNQRVRQHRYELGVLRLNILEKEVANALLEDGVASDQQVASNIARATTNKLIEKLLADEQNQNRSAVLLYAIQHIYHYVENHKLAIERLSGRVEHLEGHQDNISSELRTLLSDNGRGTEATEKLQELMPEISFLLKQSENTKRPKAPKPPSKLIGRDIDKLDIQAQLRSEKRIQLFGVPGVGKTTLARAVVAELQDEYPLAIIYFDARNVFPSLSRGEPLQSRMEVFATEVIKRFFVEEKILSDPFAFTKSILELPDVLLFVDNFEDLELLDKLLDEVDIANCMITSRNRTGNIFSIKVDLIAREHSIQLYRSHSENDTTSDEDQYIDKISDLLGDLPLAITLVAKDAGLIQQTSHDVLERLIETDHLLREVRYNQSQDFEYNAYLAFKLSYENLSQLEKALFTTFGFVPESSVNCATISRIASSVWSELDSQCTVQVRTGLLRLEKGSLCFKDDLNTYSTHPFLREFATETAEIETLSGVYNLAQEELIDSLIRVASHNRDMFFQGEALKFFEDFFDYVTWSLQTNPDVVEQAYPILINGLLHYVVQTGKILSEPSFTVLLQTIADERNDFDLKGEILVELAKTSRNVLKNSEQANIYVRQALEIEDHIEYGTVLSQLAMLETQLSADEGEIQRGSMPPEIRDRVFARLDRVQKNFQENFSLMLGAAPPEHVAAIHEWGGKLHEEVMRLEKKPLDEDGLLERESTRKFVVETTKASAWMYEKMGDTQMAAGYFIELGEYGMDDNNYDGAINWYGKALKHYKSLKDHPNIFRANIGVADAYFEKGWFNKAIPYYAKALRNSLPVSSDNIMAEATEKLAFSLSRRKRAKEALMVWLISFLEFGNKSETAYADFRQAAETSSSSINIDEIISQGSDILSAFFGDRTFPALAFVHEQNASIAAILSENILLKDFLSALD